MARLLAPLLVPVLAIAAACSPAPNAAAGSTDTTRPAAAASTRDSAQARTAVLALEQELFQSYMRGDTAPAARILAADYIGFSADGMRETKAQALAALHRDTTASASVVDSIHVDSTIVRVDGAAAVAQAAGTFRAHDRRASGTIAFRNTDVYVWRDGRWQVLATHLSRVPAPPGGGK